MYILIYAYILIYMKIAVRLPLTYLIWAIFMKSNFIINKTKLNILTKRNYYGYWDTFYINKFYTHKINLFNVDQY